MRRFARLALVVSVTLAGPAAAMTNPNSLDGARPVSAVPEPGAALLFAAGLGVSAWALRRRADRR